MNNQTTEQLKRINAKQTLGLPLTAHEKALQTLYGATRTAAETITPADIKEVCIPACETHEGYKSIKIKLRWVCPICGRPRGAIKNVRSYDGSMCLQCDGWTNPCGHTDKYDNVRKEAKTNGLNATEGAAL